MTRSRTRPVAVALAAAAAVAGLAIAAALGAFSSPDAHAPAAGPAGPAGPGPAGTSAATFLRSWVDGDGRVVRRDQGDDTVSEGQGYGLLLAVARRDHGTFERIWTWTRTHLQQPGGSLAWRWQDGHVVDPHPAADADLDVVHALQLASAAWREPDLDRAARRIADATLDHSTVPVREGRLLAAGPWAVGGASTATDIDPGYLAPGEADRLADTTGRAGWRDVAKGTAVMDRALVGHGQLPPDWAQLPAGDTSAADVHPAPTPSTNQTVAYGLEAPRLLIRLATSCSAADRRLAAQAAGPATALDAPAVRALDGTAAVGWQHPITDVAAAAVLGARGDDAGARTALRDAARRQDSSRTYYGAAWVGLGTAELADRQLGSCAGAAT